MNEKKFKGFMYDGCIINISDFISSSLRSVVDRNGKERKVSVDKYRGKTCIAAPYAGGSLSIEPERAEKIMRNLEVGQIYERAGWRILRRDLGHPLWKSQYWPFDIEKMDSDNIRIHCPMEVEFQYWITRISLWDINVVLPFKKPGTIHNIKNRRK